MLDILKHRPDNRKSHPKDNKEVEAAIAWKGF
jgi:hypothetical protein